MCLSKMLTFHEAFSFVAKHFFNFPVFFIVYLSMNPFFLNINNYNNQHFQMCLLVFKELCPR